jgi:transcriptional repressor NF-X1
VVNKENVSINAKIHVILDHVHHVRQSTIVKCYCGQLKFKVICGSSKTPTCEKRCSKLLNCATHKCNLKCHAGDCPNCDAHLTQTCYSHKTARKLNCGESPTIFYSCNDLCGKILNCGQHQCELTCHNGKCDACGLLPSRIKTCPCGKTTLNDLKITRFSCLDSIPTCGKVCGKLLVCSDTKNNILHYCQALCHSGDCEKQENCNKLVTVNCRCGTSNIKLACHESIKFKNSPYLCTKQCYRKKSCGKHTCSDKCCNKIEHVCSLTCNRTLNCGLHKCDEP